MQGFFQKTFHGSFQKLLKNFLLQSSKIFKLLQWFLSELFKRDSFRYFFKNLFWNSFRDLFRNSVRNSTSVTHSAISPGNISEISSTTGSVFQEHGARFFARIFFRNSLKKPLRNFYKFIFRKSSRDTLRYFPGNSFKNFP